MNKKLLTAIFTSIISIGLFAQEKEGKSITPPAKVKAGFEKAFAGASKAKWEKEGNGYEVSFVQQQKKMSAVFDSQGEWKETEEEIKASDLPAPIIEYIKAHYSGAKIREAAKITKQGNVINYEAEVNMVDVIFDAKGNFIKEEKEK